MKLSTKLENVKEKYENIEEKLIQSEEDYKNGKTRRAEDVFREWKLKYGI